MAKGYGSDPVRTQDEMDDATRPVDAGRKGGAVTAAPYDREGPVSARMYDQTAATSDRSGMGWILPLLVALMVVSALVWGISRFGSSDRTSGIQDGAPSASSTRPTGEMGGSRSDQSTQGLQSGGDQAR